MRLASRDRLPFRQMPSADSTPPRHLSNNNGNRLLLHNSHPNRGASLSDRVFPVRKPHKSPLLSYLPLSASVCAYVLHNCFSSFHCLWIQCLSLTPRGHDKGVHSNTKGTRSSVIIMKVVIEHQSGLGLARPPYGVAWFKVRTCPPFTF